MKNLFILAALCAAMAGCGRTTKAIEPKVVIQDVGKSAEIVGPAGSQVEAYYMADGVRCYRTAHERGNVAMNCLVVQVK